MSTGSAPAAWTRSFLLLLLLAAFAWRVQGLSAQSLWRDEVDAIYFAVRDLPQTLAMFVQAGQNGALYFLGLRPWFRLVGTSEFALRLPSAFFGVLSVPLMWQVARCLVGEPAGSPPLFALDPRQSAGVLNGGSDVEAQSDAPLDRRPSFLGHLFGNVPLLAALLLAANPYQLWYAQEGKMYTLVTALALLAAWLWLQGIQRGGRRIWALYLGVVSSAIYSHLLLILMIPLHALWFVIAWPLSRRHWRGFVLALAGLTLPYLPMVWWQWEMLIADGKRTGFSFTPLREMVQTLLLDQGRGFMPPADLAWLAPLFFLGLVGGLLGFLEIDVPGSRTHLPLAGWRRHLLVLGWLLAPVLAIYGLSLRQPIFTARYVIWIAPAIMLLLALGVQLVWRNAGRLAPWLTLLLLLYVLGYWGYAGWQQKTLDIKYDLRSAVRMIAAQRRPEDLLILQIPHMEYAYRYYSSDQDAQPLAGSDERLGRWAGGLWTNNGLEDGPARLEVDQQMRAMTDGVRSVWVMRSEVEMWDPRYLMDSWLDEHATLVEKADFHGAQVRHYQFDVP